MESPPNEGNSHFAGRRELAVADSMIDDGIAAASVLEVAAGCTRLDGDTETP